MLYSPTKVSNERGENEGANTRQHGKATLGDGGAKKKGADSEGHPQGGLKEKRKAE